MSNNSVIVAMSGGVDSSVAAALLKEQGFDVIGTTLSFWGEHNRCCSESDLRDARKVARQIGIPHYTNALHDAFKKHVVDYFVDEYLNGRTPNPCAVCNPSIKFGELLKKADELDVKFVATGHYAVVDYDEDSDRYILKRGIEQGKDQSYFLARLSQNQLARALFPIGSFQKEEIRKKAKDFGFSVASKSDSQEVCFIPDGQIAPFIEKMTGKTQEPGSIIDEEGSVLSTHTGIAGYTIGQRKGLGIATGKPMYITRIDPETNSIYVGEWDDLNTKRFSASRPNWIAITDINEPLNADVRIRYKHKASPAVIEPGKSDTIVVTFDSSQKAVTPGQLAVFYSGDIVIGSAWIENKIS